MYRRTQNRDQYNLQITKKLSEKFSTTQGHQQDSTTFSSFEEMGYQGNLRERKKLVNRENSKSGAILRNSLKTKVARFVVLHNKVW